MFPKKNCPPKKSLGGFAMISWRNFSWELGGIPGAKRFRILMGQRSSENHHLGRCWNPVNNRDIYHINWFLPHFWTINSINYSSCCLFLLLCLVGGSLNWVFLRSFEDWFLETIPKSVGGFKFQSFSWMFTSYMEIRRLFFFFRFRWLKREIQQTYGKLPFAFILSHRMVNSWFRPGWFGFLRSTKMRVGLLPSRVSWVDPKPPIHHWLEIVLENANLLIPRLEVTWCLRLLTKHADLGCSKLGQIWCVPFFRELSTKRWMT